MKTVAAFILLIALFAQVSSRYWVLLNYALNQKYIAKTLCVNRNKAMSGCNGKCYLKKQLATAEKEENAPCNKTRVDKSGILFLTISKKIITYFFAEEDSLQYVTGRQLFTPQGRYTAIFHPPQGV